MKIGNMDEFDDTNRKTHIYAEISLMDIFGLVYFLVAFCTIFINFKYMFLIVIFYSCILELKNYGTSYINKSIGKKTLIKRCVMVFSICFLLLLFVSIMPNMNIFDVPKLVDRTK